MRINVVIGGTILLIIGVILFLAGQHATTTFWGVEIPRPDPNLITIGAVLGILGVGVILIGIAKNHKIMVSN